MFNLFRKSQDSKKVSLPEREADGFVLLGDTINEQRRASKDKNSFPEAGPTYSQPVQPNTEKHSHLTVVGAEEGNETSQHLESNHFMSEFLNDVPFTLAPHVLAVQDISNGLPDQLLSYNISDNLSRFCDLSSPCCFLMEPLFCSKPRPEMLAIYLPTLHWNYLSSLGVMKDKTSSGTDIFHGSQLCFLPQSFLYSLKPLVDGCSALPVFSCSACCLHPPFLLLKAFRDPRAPSQKTAYASNFAFPL
ncbi:UBAP1-MVB12-associated (UMA)-domain containing protein 1 isoform X2 [Chelonoidis abingdonii]|uniref:UBAP1-MVB12-associated (UMA) domain containing 1 n=1 Tax=Chelonoidis abingdonii TaxID=106734 RepID=A0A8C0G3E8_CHEAB|nr:UBAP1-MVB12-associated (UMA)-domain containing protein 1 isoform X2 [Chelonoidis abingdonii]XP_032635989.1 UBAP1-MVB12-associated (UMA)-domain containing protein 1 isoform X2 [Chelonoidis abingdonii]XP_032635990.1 UBAP1-MVB12-associated (UMA)-domain containing protein 1 isoform X2 [Chelonoidis abingdonii]XP_032635991.1 UBAP1-MVB12-associated (UMA)-domain containing protein 1 isoform X2 [Chelonoidis abingdonii]XP_032635992.1 UBAP1-MVB12-associated (UMA)-domain containing protein 1 isoform X2 